MIRFSGCIGALRPIDCEQDSVMYDAWIMSLYNTYHAIGCDYIKTDTFNVNPITLGKDFASVLKHRISIMNSCDFDNFIFDIGPLGSLLEPYGNLSHEKAISAFRGIFHDSEWEGSFILETFTDLSELRCALIAYCSLGKSPTKLFISASFEPNGRTVSGDTLEAYSNLAHAFHVGGIGINCNLTAGELLPIVETLKSLAPDIPVFVQPNKSHPHADGSYDSVCFDDIESLLPYVNGIGGCCGYTPEDMIQVFSIIDPEKKDIVSQKFVAVHPSSNSIVCNLKRSIICGDRLNVYGSKKFRELVANNDYSAITEMAAEQINSGADVLDVCIDTGNPEADAIQMKSILLALSALDVPIQIDTQEMPVLYVALENVKGVPIINSCKPSQLKTYHDICSQYGALLIVQSFDNKVDTSQGSRSQICRINDIQDLQVLSISEGSRYADETIDLIKSLPCRTMLGLSNISFGLPNRSNINATYLIRALEVNTYLIMCNVNDPILGPIYKSYLFQRGFLDADAFIGVQHTELETLYDYVLAGVMPPDSISLDIDSIIHALDEVGSRYESHVYYVPQLIASANVAKSLLNKLYGSRTSNKADIIIATVHGDIHDIGKNIVKSVAQAHGFSVLDLGYDVPESKVAAAITKDTKIVALSGLITNSISSMRSTVEAVHKVHPEIVCVVGGAVVDSPIAESFGAIYAATPIDFVNICKSILLKGDS